MRVLLDPFLAAPALRSMPPDIKKRFKAVLRLLADDPTGTSNRLDVKRLDSDRGQPMYRLRVGEWRAAFPVESAIVVLRIFHRSEGYGWLADMG